MRSQIYCNNAAMCFWYHSSFWIGDVVSLPKECDAGWYLVGFGVEGAGAAKDEETGDLGFEI